MSEDMTVGKQTPLTPGVPAPDFTLLSDNGEKVSLSDFRGQPIILFFYPADWSPVCGDQVVLYNEFLGLFEAYNSQLIGVSVDGRWCHAAFAKDRNLKYPLLADFEPKGAVAKAYGVYRDVDGTSERAVFVIDPWGVIRWSYVSPVHVIPGADGILGALDKLG
jgi:peroxiredoxin